MLSPSKPNAVESGGIVNGVPWACPKWRRFLVCKRSSMSVGTSTCFQSWHCLGSTVGSRGISNLVTPRRSDFVRTYLSFLNSCLMSSALRRRLRCLADSRSTVDSDCSNVTNFRASSSSRRRRLSATIAFTFAFASRSNLEHSARVTGRDSICNVVCHSCSIAPQSVECWVFK